MAKTKLILPRADSACGKVFYEDRRSAEGHRIAMEVWDRATGRAREGYRLAVCRCKKCGGFHIGRRRSERIRPCTDPRVNHRDDFEGREIDRESDSRGDEPRSTSEWVEVDSSW